jgi:hypothetical protein
MKRFISDGQSIFEDSVSPRLKLSYGQPLAADDVTKETVLPDGTRQVFPMAARNRHLESRNEIPEPHEFIARLRN